MSFLNQKPILRSTLPKRPGFYIFGPRESNSFKDTRRHYISDWECHRCHHPNHILDQNARWATKNNTFLRIRERGRGHDVQAQQPHDDGPDTGCPNSLNPTSKTTTTITITERPSDKTAWAKEACAGQDCAHERCVACYDRDVLGFRRRYCGGGVCEEKFAGRGRWTGEVRPWRRELVVGEGGEGVKDEGGGGEGAEGVEGVRDRDWEEGGEGNGEEEGDGNGNWEREGEGERNRNKEGGREGEETRENGKKHGGGENVEDKTAGEV